MSNQDEIIVSKISKNYGPKAAMAQILATSAQSFLLIGLGMEISMPTIVIKDLYQNPNSKFSLTLNEISWYGSLLFIFHPTGSFMSGFLQERFGRKRCMIFANIPSIFGWVMLYFADSIFLIYTSTVLMGLGIGFSEAPILSYVGEITEPRLRGSMTSLATASAFFGMSILFILNYFFEWRTVALLSMLCPIICICLLMMIPESPIWFVSKGKPEKAKKALCWLRGWVEPEAVKTEHLELIHYNEVSGNNNGGNDGKLVTILAEFKHPSVYRPLRFVMIIFVIANIVGFFPARSFIIKIFNDVGVSENQDLILVVLGVLQNIGCLIVIFTVHRLGKRFLAIFTFSINTALMLLFGLYVIAMKNNYINSTPWIPITIICGIYFFGSFIGNFPWLLMPEIFPNKSRGIATGTSAGLAYLIMFIGTKFYLSVENILTLEYTLILFGSIGICSSIYIYFRVPVTENKTLLDIEKYFL